MMLYKILRSRNKERYDMAVVALSDRGGDFANRFTDLGIEVHQAGFGKIPGPLKMLRLVRWMNHWKPDVVHAWMYHSNLISAMTAAWVESKPPVIFGIRQSLYDFSHESFTTKLVIKKGATLSKTAARVVYNSSVSARQHEALGYDPRRTVILSNGFESDAFRPDRQAVVDVRAELGIDPQTVLIGMVARYHPIKDHETFLRAAAILTKSHPHVRYMLVGQDVEDSNNILAGLLNHLGIRDKVHLLGARKDIPRLTAAMDVSTCCSRAEGFANVIGEAMACQVPCVVTDVGDSAEILADPKRVVPAGDFAALANAWKSVLDLDAESRAELGARARRRVQQEFEISVITRRYEALYDEVLCVK